jgi:hypothetical protein
VLNADKSEVLPYKMIGVADWSYNKWYKLKRYSDQLE